MSTTARKLKVHAAEIYCHTCGDIGPGPDDSYPPAVRQARKHAEETGHAVTIYTEAAVRVEKR